jgi:4-carboxymuconolactone decarboxylase
MAGHLTDVRRVATEDHRGVRPSRSNRKNRTRGTSVTGASRRVGDQVGGFSDGGPGISSDMASRPATPRIAPLPASDRTPSAQALLDSVMVGGAEANIFTTLIRAEGLTRRWLPFGGKLLNGRIPARDRELLILRTGWNCRAEYEWAQHVVIGRAAGLSEEEISRIPAGPGGDWSEFDSSLLRAADELHEDWCLTDATWAALTEVYDPQQLIELPMLVGQYHMVAMTLNTLGVQLDPGLSGFPQA